MLTVAYIAKSEVEPKPKKTTAKDKLHAAAIASMAYYQMRSKARAKKMFATELEEIAQLQKQLNNQSKAR